MKNFTNAIFPFLIFISTGISAQTLVPELVTDRPDQTESTEIIPVGSLQLETGFLFETLKEPEFTHNMYTYNSSLLRYGLLENFELRLGFEILGEETESNLSGNSGITSGLGPIQTGFKIKIADESGCWPAVAFLGSLSFPFTAEEAFETEYSAGGMRFAFANSLSESLSLGYNLGAEWDGFTGVPGYFYSMALGVAVTDEIGIFAESYGLIPEEGEAEHLVDAGFTFLLAPNFQFDISGGLGLQNAVDGFFSAGFSWRIPE